MGRVRAKKKRATSPKALLRRELKDLNRKLKGKETVEDVMAGIHAEILAASEVSATPGQWERKIVSRDELKKKYSR